MIPFTSIISRRAALLVAAVIVFAAGAVLFVSGRAGLPRVSADRTRIVKSNFDFIHEHWKEEGLSGLYREEDYREIPSQGGFDQAVKLCDWTHRQWEHGTPDPYPLCNARDILRDIRSGKTGGFCGQYAYVLADVLKSVGLFNVRYVELAAEAEADTHFVVEVWIDELARWVVLDPDYNVYFEIASSGVPANAWEVRRALFGGEPVRPVPAGKTGRIDEERLVRLYANFAVSLRSDFIRHRTPVSIADRRDMFLFFEDGHTGRFRGEGSPFRSVTRRLEDLYYDCDVVRVEWTARRDAVDFSFFTDASMPNFRGFVVRFPAEGREARCGPTLRLERSGGVREFVVYPVNAYGRKGVGTTVRIRW